ncbi:MAG: phage terminase large subunit, partial [Candidatus Avispirillum sp.]
MADFPIPSPSPRQEEFFRDTHKYVAFGGARGGGKSWAVRVKALMMCLKYPGIRIAIVRRTYGELRQNHILPMQTAAAGVAVYTESKREMSFENSSVINFLYCRSTADLDKFQGTEYDVMFIDEATQFTEEMYDRMKACVRGTNKFPKRIYLTCNPGGRGHGWVKRLFIDKVYKSGENAGDYS